MVYRKTAAIEADIAKRRDRIIAATIALAAKHGIENVAPAAIARRARVAVGLPYKYFADKAEMIAAAIHRLKARDIAAIRAVIENHGNEEALSRVAAVIYARMGSRRLNALTFGSPIYREAIRAELARLLLATGIHGQRSAKNASAAILGALRGIAETSDNPSRDRSEAIRFALMLAGLRERYSMHRLSGG